MEIFHISAECFPLAKVGGLADVVGALPKYQNNFGHHSKVVIPGYSNIFKNIINACENIIKVKPQGENSQYYKVIADHLRSIIFLLAPGTPYGFTEF